MRLKGECALVTGASRGIGRSIALALGAQGAHVYVNYRENATRATEVCDQIIKVGGQATALPFDVSNPNQTRAAIESVKERKISVLVNNAGIVRDNLLLRYSLQDWNQVIETNLRSAFVTSQAVLRGMLKERKGSIIHISSVAGLMGNPGQVAYSAAKAGIIGMTKSMAKELASRNIRVNAVAPGFISTDMTEALTEEQKAEALRHIPLARMGTPEEVAHCVVFLASQESSYITGQVIVVDGGMAM